MLAPRVSSKAERSLGTQREASSVHVAAAAAKLRRRGAPPAHTITTLGSTACK